jgi:hypothetical protein
MCFLDGNRYIVEYTDQPFYPAKLIMNNWVQNLYDLIYLGFPDWTPRTIVFQPGPCEVELGTGNRAPFNKAELLDRVNEPYQTMPEGVDGRQEQRLHEINYFRAIQDLYLENGWPNQFDRETFLEALNGFIERHDKLEKRIDTANPKASRECVPLTTEERQLRKEMILFLQNTAGPLAIRL